TPLGLAMRAAAQNPESARLVGIRVGWMLALGWGLAAAIGSVAGMMVAPIVFLDPNMMGGVLLYAFAAALVGGIDSPGGAVFGGFLVGVLENVLGAFVIGNELKLAVAVVLIYAIALVGLTILAGYNGQISLGHGAFYAIGAYCAAILMDKYGVPYWATLPVAGAVCLVAGFLFGLPALRLEGLYLALATFALGVSLPALLKYHHLEKWTGGVQGIVINKPDPPFGLPINPDQWLYFFTLAIAVLMFVLAWKMLRGRMGRALVA